MIKFQVDDEWFLYDHDTRTWTFYEPEFNLVGYWHPISSEGVEILPDDFAQWLPDN